MSKVTRWDAISGRAAAVEATMGREMTEAETGKLMAELMAEWNETRAAWLAEHGNDDGFGEWFTKQSLGA